MDKILKGKVFKVGDDINTDYIIPAIYLDFYEPEDLGPHAFEGLGDEYPYLLKGHNILVAGENFGLGSAREQAPNALKGAGIEAIVAKSFARIFYRNTLNVGIAAIECLEAVDFIRQEDEVIVDLEKGTIVCRRKLFHFKIFSDHILELIHSGGMVPYLKKKLRLAV